MKFDTYIRGVAKISVGISGGAVAIAILPCGSTFSALMTAPNFLAMPFLLALPLAWRKLKGRALEPDSARWAWYAPGALVAAILAMFLFDHGNGSCFR